MYMCIYIYIYVYTHCYSFTSRCPAAEDDSSELSSRESCMHAIEDDKLDPRPTLNPKP